MTADGVDATITQLRDCICERLADSGAPVCVCSSTIGAPAVFCLGECGCDAGDGELWASLVRVYRGDKVTGGDATPTRPCSPATYYAQIRMTLTRCFPVLDDQGRLPSPEERAAAAATLHADAAELATAVACCQLDEQAYLESVNVDLDPQGGCSVMTALIRVPVSVRRDANRRVVD